MLPFLPPDDSTPYIWHATGIMQPAQTHGNWPAANEGRKGKGNAGSGLVNGGVKKKKKRYRQESEAPPRGV